MKRTLLAVSLLAVFCLAAVFGLPRYQRVREAARRQQCVDEAARNEIPLALDAKTQAILAGADRVETFLLTNPNRDYDEKDVMPLSRPSMLMEQCEVRRTGPTEGRVFAAALLAALSQMPAPEDDAGQTTVTPNNFGSDVGFRVWKGKAHTDICLGLYTEFGAVISQNAHGKVFARTLAKLGASRTAFLALSKQAFPQDAPLAALK